MNDAVKIGALGGAAYLGYLWWQKQQVGGTGAAASPGTSSPAQAASSTAAASTTPASTPAAAKYSGPSLDAMYSQLIAAVSAAYGGDPAIGCPGSGLSAGPMSARSNRPGSPGSRPGPTAALATAPKACSTPLADPNVWNWYLVNRTQSGVTNAPDPSVAFPGADLSVQITGAQYWAGVSPLLAKQLGMSGLGFFGGSFRRGGGMGFYVGPRGFGNLTDAEIAASGLGPADVAALDAPAHAAGGPDASAPLQVGALASQVSASGQYSMGSNGQLVANWIPGLSNTAVGIGAAAVAVLVLGVGMGRR